MQVKTLSLGPLGTNCYIVHQEKDALIFDPGGNPELITDFLTDEQIIPKAILLTHAHFDHIGAVDQLRKQYKIDVFLHESEKLWLTDPQLNGSLLFTGGRIQTDEPNYFLHPGKMQLSSFSFEVMHTPGHSPGSVSFIFKDGQFVIGGDVLFHNSIGRTDLPGGNINELEISIKEGLYTLPDVFTVLPGHGPSTTIGEEKLHNPFFNIS